MRIIYMHHAERNIGPNHNNPILRQEEDITKTGIEECELLGKEFVQNTNNYNIKAIVTSPYLRCKHTSEIINKYLKVPIIEDERFNECQSKEEMNSGDLWKRIMSGIDDIVKNDSYKNEDDILIVTSGINLTGFVCYFYNINPESKPKLSQGTFCSPVNFMIEKED